MKNKWLRRKVLAIILVLAMCPVPVYSEESCDHNYVENSRVDPTCTSAGQIVWECSKCHDMQTETLPQAAHNYVETVMVAPTCKGKYASDFKCSSCGDSYTEVYDPLPHNPVFHDHIDVGNCSTNGWDRYICSGCGQYFDKDVPGDPTIHSYGTAVVVKGPTCTDTGLSRETCTGCGATVDTVIPAIGGTHVMVCDPSQTVNPTCSEEGKTVWVCMHGACSYTEVTTIPKLSSHSWNDVGVAVEPTCSAPGVMNTKCYYCGTESTRELMPLTHSWKEIETVPAQCNKDGYVLLRCWDCGAEITETIHMGTVPHNHVKVDAESKAATCKEDGVLVVRCTGCGDTQTSVVSKLTVPHSYELTEELKPTCVADGYKKETCSVCGDLGTTSYPADAAYHSYKEVAKVPATCIADGSADYECQYCGDTKTEILPMSEAAHNWVDTVNCKPATCVDDGIDEKECTICHGLDTKVVPALGHSMNAGEVLIAPDCINNGQTKYTCTACGYEEYDHPAAFGHDYAYDYSVEATCIEFYYEVFNCTRCGASDIRNKGADYGDHDYIESGMTAPTCGVDGVREFTCSLCNTVRQDSIPATNLHDLKFKSETAPQGCMPGERVYECSVCGATEVEGIAGNGEHSWKLVNETAPTCGDKGFKEYACERCGITDIKVLEPEGEHDWHLFNDVAPNCGADGLKEYACTICGSGKTETLPATGEHNWSLVNETAANCGTDGSKAYKCLECGEGKSETIPALGHDWIEISYTAATCVDAGVSEVQCSICNEIKKETIPATGEHIWGMTDMTDATCTADGASEFECEYCGETKTETIRKTGHSFGSWKVEKKATTEREGRKARSCKNCGKKQIEVIAKIVPEKHDSLYRGISAWEEVYQLQLDLIELDYLHEKPDGIFGPVTEAAVIEFQQDAGLEANGIADAQTLKLIAAMLEQGKDAVIPEVPAEPVNPDPEIPAPQAAAADVSGAMDTVYDCCGHVVNVNGVAETHFCAEHQMLMETFNALIASAKTPEARVKALMQSAAMWGVELEFLYQAWMDAVSEEEKAEISYAKTMFAANLEMQENTWIKMYGEGSEEAVSRVNEMVMTQCVDLCALIYSLNAAA